MLCGPAADHLGHDGPRRSTTVQGSRRALIQRAKSCARAICGRIAGCSAERRCEAQGSLFAGPCAKLLPAARVKVVIVGLGKWFPVVLVVAAAAVMSERGADAATSSTVVASEKMQSGGGGSVNTKMKSLRLGSGRVAYLKYKVPADWSGSEAQIILLPSRSSKGVLLKRVRATWHKGKALRVRSVNGEKSIASGVLSKGVERSVTVTSRLTPGKSVNLRVKAASGHPRLSEVPKLKLVASEPDPTPAPQPTLEPAPEPTPEVAARLVAVGDISCPASDPQWNGGSGTSTRCGQASVANLVHGSDEQVLLLGDNQYSTGSLADYRSGFGSSWSSLAARLRPVPGNHEYGTSSAAGYFSYFAEIGVNVGSAGAGWYAFDAGAWRVLALDTNDRCILVSCAAGSAQEQWLRAELAQARAAGRCTLAYWHHPRASGGNHGDQSSVSALWKAMYELGGDVVLSGHDHHYQRFDPLDADAAPAADGPRQWVVGTGGYSFYPAVARAGSAKVITDTFGLLRLTLSGDSYRWEWAGVAGAGSDTGSASCRA